MIARRTPGRGVNVWERMRAEWRESLPDVIAGNDPVSFNDWPSNVHGFAVDPYERTKHRRSDRRISPDHNSR